MWEQNKLVHHLDASLPSTWHNPLPTYRRWKLMTWTRVLPSSCDAGVQLSINIYTRWEGRGGGFVRGVAFPIMFVSRHPGIMVSWCSGVLVSWCPSLLVLATWQVTWKPKGWHPPALFASWRPTSGSKMLHCTPWGIPLQLIVSAPWQSACNPAIVPSSRSSLPCERGHVYALGHGAYTC